MRGKPITIALPISSMDCIRRLPNDALLFVTLTRAELRRIVAKQQSIYAFVVQVCDVRNARVYARSDMKKPPESIEKVFLCPAGWDAEEATTKDLARNFEEGCSYVHLYNDRVRWELGNHEEGWSTPYVAHSQLRQLLAQVGGKRK